jgi:hypothetical protein
MINGVGVGVGVGEILTPEQGMRLAAPEMPPGARVSQQVGYKVSAMNLVPISRSKGFFLPAVEYISSAS